MGPRLRVFVTILVIFALLALAWPLQSWSYRHRRQAALADTELVQISNLGAATLLMLGGFRGLAVDALWLKSTSLHEDRRYFEERALLDLIVKLEPDYSSVWVYQAWNLAFNISVQEDNVEDQYKWIQEGIQFLHQGREVLPENPDIPFYLGELYVFKFPQNPRYQELLQDRQNLNNYEEAARWFQVASDLIRKGRSLTDFSNRLPDSGIFHAWRSRYQQILEQGSMTPEGFSPETLALAEPWRLKAAGQAGYLMRQYPNDGTFPMFPAQLDASRIDALLFHVRKILLAGDLSLRAERDARRIVVLGQDWLAQFESSYSSQIAGSLVQHRREELALVIPQTFIEIAVSLVEGRAYPPRPDVEKALNLAQHARDLLAQISLPGDEVRLMQGRADYIIQRAHSLLQASPVSNPSP